jgi:outer membrane biosynthesis protein TonB
MTNQIKVEWHGSLALSIFLHVILMGIFLFGVPSFFDKLPEEEAITFEILPLSAIVNVKNETKSTEVAPEVEKSRDVKKTDIKKEPKPTHPQEVEKEEPKPTPPQEVEKQEPKPVPEEKIEEKITKEAQKEKAQKEKAQKEKAQKEKAVVEKKTTPKPEDDSIDSILKNLEKDSKGDDAKASKKNVASLKKSKNNSKGDYNDEYPLSITEKLLIKNQIRKHWREPAGATNLEAIKIILHISIEKSGIIDSVVVKSIICPLSSNEMCNLIEESTLRAIKKASPLQNLSLDRYDVWKEFDIEFIPGLLE